MAVVTICSDFGAQENKICHCFHFCGPWYGVKRGLLLFNMLSSFVKAFLPRSKRQSLGNEVSTVIRENVITLKWDVWC